MAESHTIYDAIGGAAAVTAAVDAFYARVLSDPTPAVFFENTDLERLKGHQQAFFTVALRGSGQYNGRTMRAAHAGRGITNADFDRVAQHLSDALISLGVTQERTSQIMGTVAQLKSDIVEDEPVSTADAA